MPHDLARRPPAYLRQLMALRPTTPRQLDRFVTLALGLRVPRASVSQLGDAPFDYLADAYFMRGGDPVVWANRGGGKTLLGAAATLLDLIFKPGIEVRILAGSRQQADRMYEHLRRLLDRPIFRGGKHLLATAPTQSRVVLLNGSRAEVLAGSPRSVRGTRVQVVRCDEVEEMDREVWSAAQLTTMSQTCGGAVVPGRIEALSTHHRVGGLMGELTRVRQGRDNIERARGKAEATAAWESQRRVYRWNALDVIGPCPEAIPCAGCPLWRDCRGRAKEATGYFDAEELIRQRLRVSDRVWESEMLCLRPSTTDQVYPGFVRDRHVRAIPRDVLAGQVAVAGMDLGIRGQTVVLFGCAPSMSEQAPLHLVGMYAATDRTVQANLEAADALAKENGWPRIDELKLLAVDPAARQRSGQTGKSDAQVLRRDGRPVALPQAPLASGIEAVRRRLDHGRLTIDPGCTALIDALEAYRFDPARPESQTPLKDGPDHACDALRYLVLALDSGGRGVTTGSY